MDKRRVFIKIIIVVLLLITVVSVLMPEVYDYAYGYLLFSRIGRDLTVNISRDFDKAANVAFWTFDNIKGFSFWQRYRFMPSIDDSALNIYRRGFGYCDQSAHVYATIMHYLGFKVKLLMLINDKGASPHTVAIVYIDGKPIVVDTTYKFIFADKDKNPVAMENFKNSEVFNEYLKIVRDSNAMFNITSAEFKPTWFKNGIYYETFPYCRKQYILKKIADKVKQRLVRLFKR